MLLDSSNQIFASDSSNNSTQTQTGVHQIGNYVSAQGHGTSGNVNGCPALDPKCPTECSAIDSQGCVRCSCPPGKPLIDRC